MRKFAALAAALVLGAAVPTAGALLSYDLPDELLAFIASVPPGKDFAVGAGKFSEEQPADQFNFAAHHGDNGEVKGHVRFKTEFVEHHGRIDCLAVSGNRAALSGELDEPIADFDFFVLIVEDNGEPSPRADGPDKAELLVEMSTFSDMDCGLFLFASDTAPLIAQGNVVVKDRPPLG